MSDSSDDETLCFDVDQYLRNFQEQGLIGNKYHLEWLKPLWIDCPRFIEQKLEIYGTPEFLNWEGKQYSWNANFVRQALQLACTMKTYFEQKDSLRIAENSSHIQWHSIHVPMAFHLLTCYPTKVIEWFLHQLKHNKTVDCLEGKRRPTTSLFPPPPKTSPLFKYHLETWLPFYDDDEDDDVYPNDETSTKPSPDFVEKVMLAMQMVKLSQSKLDK